MKTIGLAILAYLALVCLLMSYIGVLSLVYWLLVPLVGATVALTVNFFLSVGLLVTPIISLVLDEQFKDED